MEINKKWTSVIEAIIVMLIVVSGIVWMYTIFTSSQKLSQSSQNKVLAISIAREWIEAITNIRDTNWINFSSNLENCWMTENYDRSCITNDDKYFSDWNYILYTNSDDRWVLEEIIWPVPTWFNDIYRNTFMVYIDDNTWFFTQTWTTSPTWLTETYNPIFTREIRLIPDTILDPPQKYNIESIVKWVDSSRSDYYEIKLETVLTNWKKN